MDRLKPTVYRKNGATIVTIGGSIEGHSCRIQAAVTGENQDIAIHAKAHSFGKSVDVKFDLDVDECFVMADVLLRAAEIQLARRER